MCECKICRDTKRWKDVIKNGTVYERYAVFDEMFSRIEEAETDRSFYTAILDGNWPDAQFILELALDKIKDKKMDNTDMHRIYLSRTNLLALLAKLDKQEGKFNPDACSIIKHDKQDPRFDQTLPIVCVTAIDDEHYYGEPKY